MPTFVTSLVSVKRLTSTPPSSTSFISYRWDVCIYIHTSVCVCVCPHTWCLVHPRHLTWLCFPFLLSLPQEFGLIEKRELAPMQDLIERLTKWSKGTHAHVHTCTHAHTSMIVVCCYYLLFRQQWMFPSLLHSQCMALWWCTDEMILTSKLY